MNAIELPSEADPIDEAPDADADPQAKAETARREKVRAYLERSRKRFRTSEAASSDFRNQMRIDQRFASGGGYQWEPADRQAREAEGRPCLEINRIPQFIRQVSNQNRANRSQIVIKPKGKGSTVKLAAAQQGLIRGIEVDSDADIAYDTAMEHQLRSGLGFVRLVAQWAGDDAFEQVCRITRVRNPLAVFWDPSTQDANFADCRWMHIVGAVGTDEYDTRWGRLAPRASITEFLTGQQDMQDWAPEGKVIITEYYTVDIETRMLLQMETGDRVWETDLEKFLAAWTMSHPGQPLPRVMRAREADKRIVRWCFHNAVEIIEGNEDRTGGRELPGSRIPVFPLIGDEYDLDGKVDYRGMVRDARQPQQMYNFWASSIAEAVALSPKAPWVAAKGQIENYLEDWKAANREAKAVLYYDPKAVGDHMVPPPQRNAIEPAIQAMVSGLMEADRDLMSVMGLFQPSLGERGAHNESGKAREALVQQGIVANSNYLDNLQRTKRAIGRTLLEWIPVVYDVPRIVQLVQPDGTQRPSVVYAGADNAPSKDEFPDVADMFDIGVGEFDVSVSTGPSYQTEQERTQAWLLELFKVMPPLAAIGADILLEHSTNPAAQQLAKRAKKALPQQFQDEGGDPEAKAAQMEAELAIKSQLLEKAHQAIIELSTTLETKELDHATKKQVAIIQTTAQMAIAQAKLANERDLEVFRAELARLQQMVDQINTLTVTEMNQEAADRQQRQQQAGALEQMTTQAALQPPATPGA